MTTAPQLRPAYVIHARPYRETSLLLEALTPEAGRLGLVAKGARRPKAMRGTLLQPFRPLWLDWRGRGELATLTTAEAAGAAIALSGRRLWSGFYLNELIQRLLPRHDPHPELFAAYAQALQNLAAARDAVGEEAALRFFERDLLAAIGYGLRLDRDAEQGEPLQAEVQYGYRLEVGPCREDDGYSPRVSGAALLALSGSELRDPQLLREIKRLMRVALAAQLGDRPLQSRALFLGKKAQAAPDEYG